MQFAFCLVLVMLGSAYSSWDNKDTTRKLLRTNLNCNFMLNDLCKTAEKEKFWYTTSDSTDNFDFVNNVDIMGKTLRKDIIRKVNYCCNKFSTYEKKDCLKDVKETIKVGTWFDETDSIDRDVLENRDEKYTSWVDMIKENRDEKYTTWADIMDREIVRDNRDDQYTSWTSDMLRDRTDFVEDRDDKYTSWTNDMYRTETDDVIRGSWDIGMDILDTNTYKYDRMLPKCNNCNQCRRKLERATDVTARKACSEHTYRDTTTTCCKAGKSVGFWVGKYNKDVCIPALYKFQSKVQGCGLNYKPQCRNTFLTCCMEASKMVKEYPTTTSVFEKEY